MVMEESLTRSARGGRVNIGNAAVYGLQRDLGLVGNDFNIALTVFFVPYVLFEIPSNIVLKQLKPHVWRRSASHLIIACSDELVIVSICMFLFGFVTLLQGFVQNLSGLIATRFFLGLAEAGVFPGCKCGGSINNQACLLVTNMGCVGFYLISMWYKRSEAQKRYTLFFSSTQLAGAFGGLLASAIGNMNGLQGYSAWRWIFILEGLLTCVLSFATYFLIADFPEETKWLTEEERVFIKERLRADQGDSKAERRVTLSDVVHVFKDYKIFLGGLMYFALIVPAYGKPAPTLLSLVPFKYNSLTASMRSRLRILFSHHHSNIWLLPNLHPITLGPTVCCRLWLLFTHCFYFRQASAPLSLHPHPAAPRH